MHKHALLLLAGGIAISSMQATPPQEGEDSPQAPLAGVKVAFNESQKKQEKNKKETLKEIKKRIFDATPMDKEKLRCKLKRNVEIETQEEQMKPVELGSPNHYAKIDPFELKVLDPSEFKFNKNLE